MKRIIAVLVFVIAISANAFSQIPSFRERGYKGNVSYTNMIVIWNGIDTSHGYMFNEHHYLGGGVGFYLVPDGTTYPTVVHFYADYLAYCFKRASTLVAGMKAGYARIVHPPMDDSINTFEFEPNIGWSWGFKSGQGLTLTLGTYILTMPHYFDANPNQSWPVTVIPRMSLSFEF